MEGDYSPITRLITFYPVPVRFAFANKNVKQAVRSWAKGCYVASGEQYCSNVAN
jgi:hypothetical protein